MIDWAVAFSTASQAIKLVGELQSIDKGVNEAELKLKIADLTTALADLKVTLTEARNDAVEKDEEIARLKTLQRRLVIKLSNYTGDRYRKRNDGKDGGAGNPFCDVCLQKDGLLIDTIHLREIGKPLVCPNWGARYDNLRTCTD